MRTVKRNDFTAEQFGMVSLLDLRNGDVAIDLQSEDDKLLSMLHHFVTDRGRICALAWGKNQHERVVEMVDSHLLPVEVHAAHPTQTPYRDELFHGVVLRNTLGIPRIETALKEMWRISKPGARVVARHTQWNVKLPRATAAEEEMLAALSSPGVASGQQFFDAFRRTDARGWRDVRFDVFVVATRANTGNTKRERIRHDYDWRTMMRERLLRARRYEPREIIDLISRLESTRGAKVTVERYLAVGIR